MKCFVKILASLLLFACLAVSAHSSTVGLLDDGITWELTLDGSYTVKGNGELQNSALPLFPGIYDTELVRSLVISDGITALSAGFLEKLPALEECVVPKSVTSIEKGFFDSFSNDPDFIVVCDKDSYAHAYCIENSLSFTLADTSKMRASTSLPTFDVTLAGRKYDNTMLAHPLLVYKDITYLPMTETELLPLGIVSYFKNGTLFLDICDKSEPLSVSAKRDAENKFYNTAIAESLPIAVMGTEAQSMFSEYPILQYNGCFYLPLTWELVYSSFGLSYSFDNINGLVIG